MWALAFMLTGLATAPVWACGHWRLDDRGRGAVVDFHAVRAYQKSPRLSDERPILVIGELADGRRRSHWWDLSGDVQFDLTPTRLRYHDVERGKRVGATLVVDGATTFRVELGNEKPTKPVRLFENGQLVAQGDAMKLCPDADAGGDEEITSRVLLYAAWRALAARQQPAPDEVPGAKPAPLASLLVGEAARVCYGYGLKSYGPAFAEAGKVHVIWEAREGHLWKMRFAWSAEAYAGYEACMKDRLWRHPPIWPAQGASDVVLGK